MGFYQMLRDMLPLVPPIQRYCHRPKYFPDSLIHILLLKNLRFGFVAKN